MVSRTLHDPKYGFTMVELIVVIAIMAVLATLAAPSVATVMAKRRVQSAASELQASILQARSFAASKGRPVEMWPAYGSSWNVPKASRTTMNLPAAEADTATLASLNSALLSWYVVTPCVAASATTCPTSTTTSATIANSTANSYPIRVSLPDQTQITVGATPTTATPNASAGIRFFPNGFIGNITATSTNFSRISFRICDSAVFGELGYTVIVGPFGTVRSFPGANPDTTDTVGSVACT